MKQATLNEQSDSSESEIEVLKTREQKTVEKLRARSRDAGKLERNPSESSDMEVWS